MLNVYCFENKFYDRFVSFKLWYNGGDWICLLEVFSKCESFNRRGVWWWSLGVGEFVLSWVWWVGLRDVSIVGV